MKTMQDVAERLTRLRMQAGLDPDAAAVRTGIAPERLADAENGDVVLSAEEIARVASAYGADPTEIFGGRITPLQNYAGGA